jgi:hypothetical protein
MNLFASRTALGSPIARSYALIGYKAPRDYDWLDTQTHWAEVLAKQVTHIAKTLHIGHQTDVDASTVGLTVNGKRKVTFLIARQQARVKAHHAARWRVSRQRSPSGLLVVLRLDETNKAIQDYLLLPAKKRTGLYLWLSDGLLARYSAVRVKDMNELIPEIKARLGI